ncbi:MAG: ECF transporter S component [Syntrophobacterales bacterium]|nr:ECF transporter S component [Syntrophobacterales bacterium]
MNIGQVSMRDAVFPYVLTFKNMRLYLFVVFFVALDVAIPWFCHMIHPLAGPVFLPMFFFILLAGLLFGWRAGLMVGAFTPLVSFSISGMPPLPVLPRVFIEATFYGLAAGLLREQCKLNVFWSVTGAMVIGRAAAGLSILLIYQGAVDPLFTIWKAAKLGWPGMLIQLVLLPFISINSARLLSKMGKPDAEQ